MSKPKWPTEVPVLTARDVPPGTLFCLAADVFHDPATLPEVENALVDAALASKDFRGNVRVGTKTTVARVWNLAMADLGYTEGNPEAPKAKVKK
jgi:hypothetical protein